MSIRIRIATYNVHKCRGLDRRTSPDRISAVIAALDADIIAIQELVDARDGKPEFDQARRIHSQFKGYEFCFGENRRLHDGAYGNMTLSRFSVQLCENYDLTWRRRERRGCLRTDIALADGTVLHLFNVHLGTSFAERRYQGRKLLTDEILTRPEYVGPRIIVGDFNEWMRGLASRLMGDAFAEIKPGKFLRYSRTYPGILPMLHLDHFYYDTHLVLKNFRLHRSRTALVASDHLPMVADFEIDAA